MSEERTVRSTTPSKHVFVVHSGITLVVARAVALHLGLESDAVACALFRGDWKCDFAANALQFRPIDKPSFRRFGQARRSQRALWEGISEISSGEPFALYTPQLSELSYRLISAHPKCKRVSYLEEGSLSRSNRAHEGGEIPMQSLAVRALRGLLSYGLVRHYGLINLRSSDYFPDSQDRVFYAITGHAFEGVKHRVLLAMPSNQDSPLRHKPLIVLDWIKPHEEANYLDAVSSIGRQLKHQGVDKVYIKSHPSLPSMSQKVEEALRQCELGSEELSTTTVLESWIQAGQLVIGSRSSALFYANARGAKVFTFEIPHGGSAQLVKFTR